MKLSDKDVLFEDNHILVVNKPAGLLTQPSGTLQENLEDLAKAYIKEKYNKPGAVYLHAVHRLDKPVSGVVLFAKTSKALSRLNESMREKDCEKIYLAKVEKPLPRAEGTLIDYIVHDDYQARLDPQGKKSVLHYQTKGEYIEIHLETGRYHQIRLQLSHAGSPIVGDSKYGSKTAAERIALHHSKLTIRHPVSKELLTFKADLL